MTILYPGLRDSVGSTANVYAPQHDSQLLIEALRLSGVVIGRRVLDLCTGSGVVAIAAAELGARDVTAFDISPDAIRCTRDNAVQAGVSVDARVGSWTAALTSGPYDVVVSNPPYVPTPPGAHLEDIPAQVGPAVAWNAGVDGRLILDPLCDAAPELIVEGGSLLIVHSEFCGAEKSLRRLRGGGLRADVVLRQLIPFGPVLTARARWMESIGMLPVGRRQEELVVIRAERR
ncbi:methyltransferase domain-containing protein [Mycolicibacterium sp. CH28]|uniref:HemK2/MTQ2 family protein methyltransferase n=1 Tax=Mycolicibacterium sp. CH28 TaxID=2512237 RepID=UPI001081C59A|nr:HemK2/MTQ2 family protein methyltransferase [Mycolicibacterium sp. CH28]TGD89644.1 methyltransferase domain-containing protein [Mycolicibacterium sp. CH28]